MTELINAEFEDETGTRRTLTHNEILTYVGLLAGGGNETTARLIGSTGEVLGRHPDQRRELAGCCLALPNAIEELLRYEAPSPVQARYVQHDVECHGQQVPEGSIMVILNGSANRDERHYPDGETSTSTVRSAAIPPSATASTSAWAWHWPGWRAARARRGAARVPRVGGRLRQGPARSTRRPCGAGRRSGADVSGEEQSMNLDDMILVSIDDH